MSKRNAISKATKLVIAISLCIGTILGTSTSIKAATFATNSCDPQYYDSLEARAWLEAQREITQNQNLIFKPDSILEYSCFDKHLQQVTQSASGLFSEDTRWGGSTGNMADALSSIASANDAYHTSNFNHNYLGGRLSDAYTPEDDASAANYACDTMNTVWQQAKCMDFIQGADTDGFFTFQEYHQGADMRQLPVACNAGGATPPGPSAGNHTADYWTRMANATGGDLNNDGTIDPGEGTSWTEDQVSTYFYLFTRPTTGGDYCGNNTDAGNGMPRISAVRTGLVISRTTATPRYYNEYVCLVPGCYYQPGGTGNNYASPSDSGRCCMPGDSC